MSCDYNTVNVSTRSGDGGSDRTRPLSLWAQLRSVTDTSRRIPTGIAQPLPVSHPNILRSTINSHSSFDTNTQIAPTPLTTQHRLTVSQPRRTPHPELPPQAATPSRSPAKWPLPQNTLKPTTTALKATRKIPQHRTKASRRSGVPLVSASEHQ